MYRKRVPFRPIQLRNSVQKGNEKCEQLKGQKSVDFIVNEIVAAPTKTKEVAGSADFIVNEIVAAPTKTKEVAGSVDFIINETVAAPTKTKEVVNESINVPEMVVTKKRKLKATADSTHGAKVGKIDQQSFERTAGATYICGKCGKTRSLRNKEQHKKSCKVKHERCPACKFVPKSKKPCDVVRHMSRCQQYAALSNGKSPQPKKSKKKQPVVNRTVQKPRDVRREAKDTSDIDEQDVDMEPSSSKGEYLIEQRSVSNQSSQKGSKENVSSEQLATSVSNQSSQKGSKENVSTSEQRATLEAETKEFSLYHTCQTCFAEFLGVTPMKKHVKRGTCSPGQLFTCDGCGLRNSSSRALSIHAFHCTYTSAAGQAELAPRRELKIPFNLTKLHDTSHMTQHQRQINFDELALVMQQFIASDNILVQKMGLILVFIIKLLFRQKVVTTNECSLHNITREHLKITGNSLRITCTYGSMPYDVKFNLLSSEIGALSKVCELTPSGPLFAETYVMVNDYLIHTRNIDLCILRRASITKYYLNIRPTIAEHETNTAIIHLRTMMAVCNLTHHMKKGEPDLTSLKMYYLDLVGIELVVFHSSLYYSGSPVVVEFERLL